MLGCCGCFALYLVIHFFHRVHKIYFESVISPRYWNIQYYKIRDGDWILLNYKYFVSFDAIALWELNINLKVEQLLSVFTIITFIVHLKHIFSSYAGRTNTQHSPKLKFFTNIWLTFLSVGYMLVRKNTYVCNQLAFCFVLFFLFCFLLKQAHAHACQHINLFSVQWNYVMTYW